MVASSHSCALFHRSGWVIVVPALYFVVRQNLVVALHGQNFVQTSERISGQRGLFCHGAGMEEARTHTTRTTQTKLDQRHATQHANDDTSESRHKHKKETNKQTKENKRNDKEHRTTKANSEQRSIDACLNIAVCGHAADTIIAVSTSINSSPKLTTVGSAPLQASQRLSFLA